MLMRKRAWDIMRDDFTTVGEDAELVDVIRILHEGVRGDSDNHIAVVRNDRGEFKGVVTMWHVMRRLEECVFSDETLVDLSGQDWDKAFALACRSCAGRGIKKVLDKKVPKVLPNDPLITVVTEFLNHQRDWSLVCEADKVLGVIFKSDIFKEVSRDVLSQIR